VFCLDGAEVLRGEGIRKKRPTIEVNFGGGGADKTRGRGPGEAEGARINGHKQGETAESRNTVNTTQEKEGGNRLARGGGEPKLPLHLVEEGSGGKIGHPDWGPKQQRQYILGCRSRGERLRRSKKNSREKRPHNNGPSLENPTHRRSADAGAVCKPHGRQDP